MRSRYLHEKFFSNNVQIHNIMDYINTIILIKYTIYVNQNIIEFFQLENCYIIFMVMVKLTPKIIINKSYIYNNIYFKIFAHIYSIDICIVYI